ncbi:mRNA export factor Gle1 [Diorhabda sublineata]|uniref:mRNA export factor Gle1 n=1 Tax=Diorhabda sublineata TaxID=1163346 RepID=UPI0024E162CC|nr:mRNA export factor Gle1 [Diorhabda sublineata]
MTIRLVLYVNMEDALSFEFQLKLSIINKLEKINSTLESANDASSKKKEDVCSSTSINTSCSEETDQKLESSEVQFDNLLQALELQRKKTVINNIQARIKKFEDFTIQQELNSKNEWIKKQKEFIEDIQKKENDIIRALEEYDKKSSNSQAQLNVYYKDLELRRQNRENEIQKKQQERQIIYKCMDKIKKLQVDFRNIYEEILLILKTCLNQDDLKNSATDYFKSLKSLSIDFDDIVNKCKNGKITEEIVKKADDIVTQLRNIKIKINDIVNEINKNEQKAASTEHIASHTNVEKYVSLENFDMYTKYMEFYDKYTSNFKDMESDPDQKPFILDCKKAVNIPVNSLSGANPEHISDKYNKLYSLLKGQDVIITDKRINASSHQHGVAFCVNLLAKRFILQSDLIISSNAESAFCYATVIVSLWNEFPTFGELLLAHFYKACPYLVPFNVPREVGESDEEYYMKKGYQYKNGQIEKQDKFLKRMTGLMRLYAAIMVVKPKKGHVNVYNIKNGWRWLASTLKLEPEVDISATLVHTFLETAGFELDLHYGMAFHKLLRIIVEKFLPSCREKCTGGSVTRLELLMMEYSQKKKFETPDGYLGYTYW